MSRSTRPASSALALPRSLSDITVVADGVVIGGTVLAAIAVAHPLRTVRANA